MLQVDLLEPEIMPSVKVILSIGSNFGDRHENVSKALNWLSTLLSEFKCSSIYATPDCHGGNQEYLNAVVSGYSKSTPEEIDSICKAYEVECGRDDEMRKRGDVPLDVDLVVFDGNILRPNDFKREFFQIGYRMI